MPDLATGFPRHGDEGLGAIKSYRLMAQLSEGLQIAPRPAANIQDSRRRLNLDVAQQRIDILRHVMISRSFTKGLGALTIMVECALGDELQVVGVGHGASS